MEWNLRELRFFVAAAEAGSFTSAAAELYVSQAAVSRTIAGLEAAAGEKLLRRVPRGCELTSTGQQVLPHARRVLAEAERFTEFLRSRHGVLRLGYAWAAIGRHTARLQRTWSQRHQATALELIRHNSPTAGLSEGLCDVAVVRRAVDDRRFDSVVVGLERRLVAFASDDPQWARRRQVRMAEIAERTVIIDQRVGTTSGELWHGADRTPQFVESTDVDSWLDAIVAGRGVGTTAEATAYHHPRPGVSYRPIKDGPRIPVTLAWWRDERPHGLSDLVDAITELYATA
ncbi:LysR family transcriptional regulator [Amycolatopsis endophytica]|uniref:DNA-binding transcriptional LysR family regulator n=1 Tax=Amycolatopsis endophytica TaxID=860233 RepID=A0A853BAW1_9PSEU|nr:LysR family transcriptional regulator [Amycolatopsis endophytica]NYI92150.1 DNA-binding transcriptional LysR family regulator [Amycolatopsis endophytica]